MNVLEFEAPNRFAGVKLFAKQINPKSPWKVPPLKTLMRVIDGSCQKNNDFLVNRR